MLIGIFEPRTRNLGSFGLSQLIVLWAAAILWVANALESVRFGCDAWSSVKAELSLDFPICGEVRSYVSQLSSLCFILDMFTLSEKFSLTLNFTLGYMLLLSWKLIHLFRGLLTYLNAGIHLFTFFVFLCVCVCVCNENKQSSEASASWQSMRPTRQIGLNA